MFRELRLAAALALVYVLTLGSSDPLDIATGLAIGIALALALGRRIPQAVSGALPPFAARAVYFPVFAGAVLVDVMRGTWLVIRHVLRPRGRRPGIVRIPIGERTDRGVAVSSLVSTLSPGSVLLDVDWERRDIVMHFIDATDPDAVRAEMQRFYDRYQRRVFP